MTGTIPPLRADPPPIWPEPLQPGDLLAVVAPASPVAPDLFAKGAAVLESWGLRLIYGPEIFAPRPYRASADLQVCRHLQLALTDPAVAGLICARGGYGAIRILEHLEPRLFLDHPKLLIGFSDITNLLCLVTQRTGLVTFHGPTVAHLGEVTPVAREQCRNLLMTPTPDQLAFSDLEVLCPGSAQAPLIGGNLTTIGHLAGTPFALSLAGQILFLEDHNEAPYRVDRLLQQLRLSGGFQGLRGLILGSFSCCGDIRQIWEIFTVLGEELEIPVLAGLPAGHQPENFTLPLGARVEMNGSGRSLKLVL